MYFYMGRGAALCVLIQIHVIVMTIIMIVRILPFPLIHSAPHLLRHPHPKQSTFSSFLLVHVDNTVDGGKDEI